MSFNAISAPASSDRPSAPASFADSRFHSGAWPSRHDWHVLLDRWKRVQPYADRFATVFLDTLFASGTDFRQLFGSGSLEVQFVRLAHVLTQIVCADSNRDAMHVRVELLVRRFVRDDAGTLRSRALRAAVAATIREVAASEMSTQTRASWKSAYVTVGAIFCGTTYVDARGFSAIRYPAVGAEIGGDRHLTSVERLVERTTEAEAA